MPRRTTSLLHRLSPARRAAGTAGVTAVALLVGVGGYSLATSPAFAEAAGDRVVVAGLLTGPATGEGTASAGLDPAADRDAEGGEASRSRRATPAPGLPSTAAEAQGWVDEVVELEATLAEVAAAEEAARVAAEAEAARVAAEEEAARVAAEAEAARVAAEEEAARVAAEEEAARVAAEEEAARVAAEEEAARAAAATAAPGGNPGSNREVGRSVAASFGFSGDQWSCLDKLWQKESGWDHRADNPSSSAYGIPQSLPGSKMASAGSDWETNPETQVRWGLGYIQGRYGTPCSAWAHSQANNWY